MPEVINDKTQVYCEAAEEGWQQMRDSYDLMPKWMRELLANSRFNICPTCFSAAFRDYEWRGGDQQTLATELLREFEERIANQPLALRPEQPTLT